MSDPHDKYCPNIEGCKHSEEYWRHQTSWIGRPGYVDRYDDYNPEIEELLFDGTYLCDGMRVLLDWRYREKLSQVHGLENQRNASEKNRWCEISHLRMDDQNVAFFATYDDGRIIKRIYQVSTSWIVKKKSLELPILPVFLSGLSENLKTIAQRFDQSLNPPGRDFQQVVDYTNKIRQERGFPLIKRTPPKQDSSTQIPNDDVRFDGDTPRIIPIGEFDKTLATQYLANRSDSQNPGLSKLDINAHYGKTTEYLEKEDNNEAGS